MNRLDEIFLVLPATLKNILTRLEKDVILQMEEIRIRIERPLEIVFAGHYSYVCDSGELTSQMERAYYPTHDECLHLLDLLSNHSLYTVEEELKRGFITIRGGHRVGLVGRTVLERGAVKLIRDIGGFNIRIAKELRGVGQPVLPYLLDMEQQSIYQTLIISPPQMGKTTLARDLARLISSGEGFLQVGWRAKKVGIVDERSELAACYKGVPRYDVGPRTDVLDGCPKAEGMMMMIRSMSPEVLVVDEIGRKEDVEAIEEAIHAGIKVLATVHAFGVEDVRERPILRELFARRSFSRYVVLGGQKRVGAVAGIYNEQGLLLRKTSLAAV